MCPVQGVTHVSSRSSVACYHPNQNSRALLPGAWRTWEEQFSSIGRALDV